MAEALAGNRVRAEDIVDTVAAGIVEDTSIGTAAANFTASTTLVRTAMGGRDVYLFLIINTTNALTATGGNITDTTMFTLDTAYRPSEAINCAIGNGSVSGEAVINTNGTVQVRAASDTIAAGTNIRLTARYITAG